MTHDPDILAIKRKWRQEGRCVECGRVSSPDTLCVGCRLTLAYCPVCENTYTRRAGTPVRDSSAYCTPCLTIVSRKRHTGRTRAEWRADVGSRRRRLLPEIIRRYKGGQTIPAIAEAVGLRWKQLDKLIQAARIHDEWPEGLQRKPSRRKVTNGKPGSDQCHE